MEQRDVVARLDQFDVVAHIDVQALDGLAVRRGRRAPQVAGLAVVAAGLVSVLWVASERPPVPIIEGAGAERTQTGSPDAEQSGAFAGTEPNVRTPDPDRPWQQGELARLTFEASSGGDLPVAITVREPDGRMSDLWLSYAEEDPFGLGTTVVQGHRTTYGAALYHLDVVEVGDEIVVDLPDGDAIRYRVINSHTVPAGQHTPTIDTGEVASPRLLITTHAPRFTARDLLVITAEQV